ncbi:signal peptide peptidase-like 4-like, partial [Trifolium medium]|nr:signal peptide peptidase-like 4-like [Trifolium medium]
MVSFGDSSTYAVFSVFMVLLTVTFAGDIVHPDKYAPKKPGCDNNFVL